MTDKRPPHLCGRLTGLAAASPVLHRLARDRFMPKRPTGDRADRLK